MRAIAVLLVVCLLLACPVSALTTFDKISAIINARTTTVNGVSDYTYDASQIGHAVYLVKFTVPSASYVNFTLYYGTDKSVDGSAQSDLISYIPPTTRSTITLNGVTKTYTFWDTQPVYDYNIAGYGSDANGTVKGFAVYSEGYGSWDNDLAVGYEVPNTASNLIYKFHITGPRLIDITYTTAPFEDISRRLSLTETGGVVQEVQSILAFAADTFDFVFDAIVSLFYWLKFFFVDHLVMTVALYLTMTMVFAARASRGNMATFLRRWFSDQRKFFDFIINLWRVLVEILATLRGIFRI